MTATETSIKPLPPNQRRSVQLAKGFTLTPARLMIWTWICYSMFYAVVPIVYERGIHIITLVFTAVCVISFSAASALTQGRGVRRGQFQIEWNDRASQRFNRLLRGFAIVGVVGGALVLSDKVLAGGLALSDGLGALRSQLNAEFQALQPRSLTLWVGTLLYSFSNVALILYLLEGERVRRGTATWVLISSFSPVLVIALYGGRSNEFIVMALIVVTGIVRTNCGKSFSPRAPLCRTLIVAHALLIVAGTMYVTADRAQFRSQTVTSSVWGFLDGTDATVSPGLAATLTTSEQGSESRAQLVMFMAYLTHSVNELDYLLTESPDAGPFWGMVNFWPLQKVRQIMMGDDGDPVADALGRSGLFQTAWGVMYLDFGLYLAPLSLFLAGLGAGGLYRKAVIDGSLEARMVMSYVFLCIIVSPVLSGIQVGNSALILLSFAASWLPINRLDLNRNAHKFVGRRGCKSEVLRPPSRTSFSIHA